MFASIVKTKIIGILLVCLLIAGGIFIYFKNCNDKVESFLFVNKMNGNTGLKSTFTSEDMYLLEFCRVWGTLKYHGKNTSEAFEADSLLINNFDKIFMKRVSINKVISEFFNKKKINKENIFLGQLPDYNWITESRIINTINKKKLLTYINISNENTSSNKLITVNSYDELIFDADSLFFNKKNTSRPERFLSLCKIWNTVRYYYPYFNDLSSDWNDTFLELLPHFLNAKTELEYHKAVIRLSSKLQDSHVAVKSSLIGNFEKKYVGNVIFKTIEERTFVKDFVTAGLKSNMRKGDEILEINGINVQSIRDSLKEFISASNNITLDRDINKQLLVLQNKSANIKLIRKNKIINIRENLTYIDAARKTEQSEQRSRASMEVSKILPHNIGYINIKDIYSGNFRISFEKIKNCNAIIFDIRSYPNEIGVNFLKHFATRKLKFMNLYRADVKYPGVMISTENKIEIPATNSDSYSKPVIILINEYTQSQSESIVLAMKAIGNSTTLGENTAGTNGNVSILYLPGNLKMRFSGIGVLGSNNEVLQRKGIQPEIIVKDNINSLIKGEDYQLLSAIKYLEKIL